MDVLEFPTLFIKNLKIQAILGKFGDYDATMGVKFFKFLKIDLIFEISILKLFQMDVLQFPTLIYRKFENLGPFLDKFGDYDVTMGVRFFKFLKIDCISEICTLKLFQMDILKFPILFVQLYLFQVCKVGLFYSKIWSRGNGDL